MLRFPPCGERELEERRCRPPTIVVVHEHAGVLELIEAVLRDRGAHVLATLDLFEARETLRMLKVDVLLTSRALSDVVPDLRASQPDLPLVVLDDAPMSLDEIVESVVAALELD